MNNSPIGIFDSGIGGLSVLSQMVQLLPMEEYLYLADTKNLPYGNKSKDELIDISVKIFDFFKEKKVKAVIMACNTTSSNAYDVLKSKYDFEIYPIVQTTAKYIADKNYSSVGVFATPATVNAHAYRKEILEYNIETRVFEIACPMWVSIVENSTKNDKKSEKNIKMLVNSMLQNDVQKIVLGCTHYPYLMDMLSKYANPDLFLDPAVPFSRIVVKDLKSKNLINNGNFSKPKFFVTGDINKFVNTASPYYKVNSPDVSPCL